MSNLILAINPGSTSTKFAVYKDEKQLFSKTLEHLTEELEKFDSILDQYNMRKTEILKVLEENDIDIKELTATVGRVGGLPPVKSGAYLVTDEMIDRLRYRPTLDHASNLGAIIADSIAKEVGINAYTYDSISVDELKDVARPSGLCGMDRHSLFHALNSRAMAMKYAKSIGKEYEDLSLIVAHLGGGISISAHNKGKIVDIVSDEEGAFSPQRAGKLPVKPLIKLCFSGKHNYDEVKKMHSGRGGLVSYLNTSDAREVEKMIEEGNQYAKLIYDAMILQISKGIGELAASLKGDIDAIIITGGIAYSKYIIKEITEYVKFISNVVILPGENELESLAYGALRVIRGEEKATVYRESDFE